MSASEQCHLLNRPLEQDREQEIVATAESELRRLTGFLALSAGSGSAAICRNRRGRHGLAIGTSVQEQGCRCSGSADGRWVRRLQRFDSGSRGATICRNTAPICCCAPQEAGPRRRACGTGRLPCIHERYRIRQPECRSRGHSWWRSQRSYCLEGPGWQDAQGTRRELAVKKAGAPATMACRQHSRCSRGRSVRSTIRNWQNAVQQA